MKKPENNEIKELWEKLPRSNAKKAVTFSSDSQSTTPSSPNTLMPVSPKTSSSQSEGFVNFFDVLDVTTGFDNSQFQPDNPDNKNGHHLYNYHQQRQHNQFDDEEEADDDEAYQKRVFEGLSNGTFPWNF